MFVKLLLNYALRLDPVQLQTLSDRGASWVICQPFTSCQTLPVSRYRRAVQGQCLIESRLIIKPPPLSSELHKNQARAVAAQKQEVAGVKASHVLQDFQRDHQQAVERESEQLKLKCAQPHPACDVCHIRFDMSTCLTHRWERAAEAQVRPAASGLSTACLIIDGMQPCCQRNMTSDLGCGLFASTALFRAKPPRWVRQGHVHAPARARWLSRRIP